MSKACKVVLDGTDNATPLSTGACRIYVKYLPVTINRFVVWLV